MSPSQSRPVKLQEPLSMSTPAVKSPSISAVAFVRVREETIRKELRSHHLHEGYTVTPTLRQTITLCETPTSVNVQQRANEPEDESYNQMAREKETIPRQKFVAPRTGNMEYGWDSETLLKAPKNDTRFNHPKNSTEITRHAVFTKKTEKV